MTTPANELMSAHGRTWEVWQDRDDKHGWGFVNPDDGDEYHRLQRLFALRQYRQMKADARWNIERAAQARADAEHYGRVAVIDAAVYLAKAGRITRHAAYLATCRGFTADEMGEAR